jgi:hypothetical protein
MMISPSDTVHIERRNRAIGTQRIGDLNTLYVHRYGGGREGYVFPEDDAGLEDLEFLLHHYSLNNPLAIPRIIKLRAPWMDKDRARRLQEQIEAFPRKWRSEKLGQLLRVTGAEWRVLRLRTIAPIDMTKEERRAFSRALYQQRRQAKRKADGVKSRAEYEARSLSRSKPWEAEGISRRTWERRQKSSKATCRKSGGNKDLYSDDALATSEQERKPRKGWASGAAAAALRSPSVMGMVLLGS